MIHATADIDPSAKIAGGVSIGAYSVIGADVEIGEGCWIGPHVVIQGPAKIGKNNRFYQFASIGADPQDLHCDITLGRLEIGDNNLFREFCTINRGTSKQDLVTKIGSNCMIMAYVHIAHDCVIGNHVLLTNMATLGGHVVLEDHVILGGGTLVHQFCRIGPYAFTAGGSGVVKDVLPHTLVKGNPAVARSLNLVGIQRAGFSKETVSALKTAFKLLCRRGMSFADASAELVKMGESDEQLKLWAEFVANSERGVTLSEVAGRE